MGWLGPGQLVEDPVVVMAGGTIAFAGSGKIPGVLLSSADSVESLSGAPLPPAADRELAIDGFIMPGVVDRHVHMGLSDPWAVLTGGVTAVRDLGWPAEAIFSLVEA